MNTALYLLNRVRLGGLVPWITVAVLLSVAPCARGATTYLRGSVGHIDVLSGDSQENTKQLLCEILEIRRQLQSLVGSVPLPDPPMQVVLFRTMRDYRDFAPPAVSVGVATGLTRNLEPGGAFTADDGGLTFTLVRDGDYDDMRQIVLTSYARYLLLCVVPKAPLWIQVGLPELFSTIRCRQNKVFIGKAARNHAGSIRGTKLLALAHLMDDATMDSQRDILTHDTALYHESWALWHQWLIDGKTDRREQIRRLLEAVQRGAPGNVMTVSECFGQSLTDIEDAHRNRKFIGGFHEIEANADAESLVTGLRFVPAVELDRKVAMAKVLGRTRKELGTLGYELLQLVAAYPESPRLHEGLAVLAAGAGDTGGSERYWERARELKTENPFPYLLAARRAVQNRVYDFSLKANLPEALVESERALLQQCLTLDPGQDEAQYYLALVEAFAPSPRRDLVEAVTRSHAAYLRPGIFLSLAIARWRLGDHEAAHQLLTELQNVRMAGEASHKSAQQLDQIMHAAEKRTD